MEDNIEKEILQFISLDKSWLIRIGILDLINGKRDILEFLNKQTDLGEDLLALKRIAENWGNDRSLDIGESGTICRFVRFYLWKNKLEREIITHGTLVERSKKMCNNPNIVNWDSKQLLELDNRTSQWATMAYLLGDRRKVENPPFKLQLTYDAVEHWEKQRREGKIWEARYDKTILNQALAFIGFLKTGEISFFPEQQEDYCFARAFGLIDKIDGEQRFPSLRGHETDRIEEMRIAIQQADNNEPVTSIDHRVVQAIAIRQIARKQPLSFMNKGCVNKSWPKFWDFIDYCETNLKK